MRVIVSAGSPHGRLLAREYLASALYLALVLLTALVALPTGRLPEDGALVATLLGTALGLMLAHWLAFRMAAHLTAEGGEWPGSAIQEAAAQLAGGASVALLACLPFLVTSGPAAVRIALIVLATLPALTGAAIARLRGATTARTVLTGAVALAIALAIVALKASVDH